MVIREEALEAAIANCNMICKAVGPAPHKPLAEICSFPGGMVFDRSKVEEYIKANFVPDSVAHVNITEGSDIVQMAENYSASLSVSGSYGFPCGASVSGSISSDFSSSTESERTCKFSQVRKTAHFGAITFPTHLLRDNLRHLVRSDVLQLIDECDSFAKAMELVNEIGGTYFHSATYGGVLTMSTKSESSSFKSSQDLSVALEAEAKCLTASVSTSGKFQIGSNKGRQNSSLNIHITAHGGNPALILEGKETEWISSTVGNPSLVNFELAPISELAEKNSQAEKFLLEAVREVCTGELGKFKTTGFESGVYALQGDLYLNANTGQKQDGGQIYQWNYPQKWTISEIRNDGDPIVSIKSNETHLYVNSNCEYFNGGGIHQWDYPMEWRLKNIRDDGEGNLYANIENVGAGDRHLYLNLDVGDVKNGGKIHLWNYVQDWKLVKQG